MNRLDQYLAVALVATGMSLAAGSAQAAVTVDITQSGSNVDVTTTGSLDLAGATYDHAQAYSTGIIPGGSNWYIATGTSGGMDWYQLTSTSLPFGSSTNYFQSSNTSGDAFSIWGYAGQEPLVGLSTGYTSGTSISSSMVIGGETISAMSLTPGSYVFKVPADTITVNISAVPEPATWVMLLAGGLAVGLARYRKGVADRA